MSDFSIRPLEAADKERWLALWKGYLVFYKSSVADDVTQETWNRIISDEQIFGLCAQRGEELLGFTHYHFHLSTWSKTNYCYLEDLFVSPDARGLGVARALIQSVNQAANELASTRLYWHTQNDNQTARLVYDKLAQEAGFVQYRMPLQK